ncbi:MAG: FtsX-like permease family protein [Chitinophagaceae bacterium]|nr:MAG: FtsX-like permease family protein [Chitinophagaceae bacterium]
MFKSYLKIAWRNIWRSKGLSMIHILGLSLGLATTLLIVLYIRHELSYDRFNKNAADIVRVVFNGRMQGGEIHEANVMPMVAPTFKMDFPEIKEAVRIRAYGTPRVNYGEKTLRTDRLAFADPAIFQVFSFNVQEGNAANALASPGTIVITKAVAERYFGTEAAMGKTLLIGDTRDPYKVTGVMDEMPENSHFHFDILASMSGLAEASQPTWMTSNFYTYLLLRPGTDIEKLQARIQPMVGKYMGPELEKTMGLSYSDFVTKGNSLGFALQPVTDIHLHSNMTGEYEPSGDMQYIYIFGAVAVFMLLIACINFMNLSTAGASRRAREIGIRKVMGSVRSQLVAQFIFESMMITCIALVVSLALVYLAIPYFNKLAAQDLGRQLTSDPSVIGWMVLFGLLTGLLAGSYPAFYLSSFKPIRVLKSKLTVGKRTLSLRSGLVVFQFFISISLIVGTITVYQQLSFIRNKKLGYDKEQVLVIQETWWLKDNQAAFRQQLLADPRILSVTSSGYLPAGPSNNNNFLAYPDNQSTQLVKSLRYEVDEQYLATLGMRVKSGRNFSNAFGSDSTAVILNESAAKMYGWDDKAEGHTITSVNNENQVTYHVIGVVKDFHFRSLHEKISPLVMSLGSDYGTMIAKVKTADISSLLSSLSDKWKSFRPEAAFTYSFLDDRFNATYKSEKNIATILAVFAVLTILVACLGLFGLAMFTAEQRTREIGIRKVLGASSSGIVALLSKDYVKLVLIGFLIATPIAWTVMNNWLQDFAYRISMSWWIFAISALFAVLIAIITVSSQAIRAANTNPVKSLKGD